MSNDRNTASICLPGRENARVLLICDHASNYIPAPYGTLGLDPACLSRHIAYDIGAERVTRGLAGRLGAPAVLSRFSRLVIDPNRGADDPTLVMKLSDGAIIPGNRDAGAAEIAERMAHFYTPYDEAISQQIAALTARGGPPALISIHSFTPSWRGAERPWHFGVLWDRDARIAGPLLGRLRQEAGMVVGDNQPYSGALSGDTMNRHGTRKSLAHGLIEIRQDLIDTDPKADRIAGMLAEVLTDVLAGV